MAAMIAVRRICESAKLRKVAIARARKRAVPALAAAMLGAAATDAAAQELVPYPVGQDETPAATVVIAPEAVPAEAGSPPTPEETIDEATAALVAMLVPDDDAGPPMAECAVDLLRTRLATAVNDPDEVLTAIALETELLELCRQRQTLVAEVLTTELLIAALLAGEDEPPAAPAPAAALPAVLQPPAIDVLDQLAEPDPAEPAPEPEPEPDPVPDLAWFSILGAAGQYRAAVTDGYDVWWVREGSTLADGLKVTRITARPPGVTVSHPETGHYALPFHTGAQPGAGEN